MWPRQVKGMFLGRKLVINSSPPPSALYLVSLNFFSVPTYIDQGPAGNTWYTQIGMV